MTDSVVLVTFKKQNDYLFLIGITALSLIFLAASFNWYGVGHNLHKEFAVILVFFFIWLIIAKFFFVHTIICAKEGLIYCTNMKTICIPWSNIGSVELTGDFVYHRHCFLLIRNSSGRILKSIPTEKLQMESSDALTLMRSHI